jgi:Protein of unknown function (DUF2490)
MKKTLLLMVTGLVIRNAMAQQPSTTHWFGVQLPVAFNNHWQWWNEACYRTYGETIRLNQFFMRTGARYSFNENWSITACADKFFTKVTARKEDHEFGKETRFWQELNFQFPLKNNFIIQNRFRIEERFLEGTSKAESYHAFRFRYRLATMKKLSEKWSVQLGEEFLEQIAHDKIGFNLNRVSLSGIYQFRSTTQLQGIYYWSKSAVMSQHIFSIVFQKKILFHPKKKTSA